ncbi:hypothetical protein HXX76_005983 [Chlamydomonas incerta]|uniref:Uncharacterized protein n=1 Tax=Chlamydomonas incerta TaxID=51695 RepID=A0A835T4P2_CHLIN|nr:hypothetical protein HXX76_005983 [Chlamydomonas incerta]|eukprot:KAG2437326.1 hypothetical protein HXX76_005983 [Chlamydomonas incerta]
MIMDIMDAEITKNGTQRVDPQCDSLFGRGYINTWANAKKEICKPGGGSTFTCHEHPGTNRGPNIGSLFCHATNLVLDSKDFLGEVLTKPGTRYPTPKRGSAKVACEIERPYSREQLADQHTERWQYDALATAPAADVSAACADPRRTVSYPVYFVTRMDPTNAYHHFEEVMNFFAAMYMYPHKELLQQGITIVAFDGAPKGFYLELWRRIAYPFRIRFLRERPYPDGTCFKNVLIASMPHRSMYTHFWPGVKTMCRSLFMSSAVRWTHMLMADARPEMYGWPDGQHRQNEDTVVGRVTWVSRRHFEAANQGKMNSWQIQRMLSNEDAIVPVLSNAVMAWNAKSCLRNPGDGSCRKVPVYFEFATMELGDHRWYPEQLQQLSRTSVLMAVHGAGVFNEIWLRPSTSSVIEVLHNSGGNHHYHNIASFIGLPYHDMGSAHDPNTLAAKLTEVMDSTAVRMAEEHGRKMAALRAAGTA